MYVTMSFHSLSITYDYNIFQDVDDLRSLDAEALLEMVRPLQAYARDLASEREKDREALRRYQEALQRHQDRIRELENEVEDKTTMLDIATDEVERLEAEAQKNRDEDYAAIVSGMERSDKRAECVGLMKDEIFALLDYAKL
jgi:chromosome segregation ATPase